MLGQCILAVRCVGVCDSLNVGVIIFDKEERREKEMGVDGSLRVDDEGNKQVPPPSLNLEL